MDNIEIPAEVTELRELHDAAMANTELAQQTQAAAMEEFRAASDKLDLADMALAEAARREAQARTDYITALRYHGYVQTADGPRPAARDYQQPNAQVEQWGASAIPARDYSSNGPCA